MKQLTVDLDKVLEAAKKCPDFKRIAETLWPDEMMATKSVDITTEDGKGFDAQKMNDLGIQVAQRAADAVGIPRGSGIFIRSRFLNEPKILTCMDGWVIKLERK